MSLRLFKFRVNALFKRHGQIKRRRRTQKLQCKTEEIAREYADNLRKFWGYEIIWIKEVLKDGTEREVATN